MEIELIYRLLSAFFMGGVLFLGGSVTQIYTQNELSSPSTLGFDGIAALCVIVIHVSFSWLGLDWMTSHWSFKLGFLILIGLIYLIMNNMDKIREQLNSFILFGLCLNLLVGAVFSLLYFMFLTKSIEFPSQLFFGQFKFAGMEEMLMSLFIFVICWLLSFWKIPQFCLVVYGDDFCKNIGLDTKKLLPIVVAISFLSVLVSASFFGVFAFVGLLFPHLIRLLPGFSGHIKRELTFWTSHLWGHLSCS
jgi:iron complex transport system permease protein